MQDADTPCKLRQPYELAGQGNPLVDSRNPDWVRLEAAIRLLGRMMACQMELTEAVGLGNTEMARRASRAMDTLQEELAGLLGQAKEGEHDAAQG